jgi:GTP-binding protein HflX
MRRTLKTASCQERVLLIGVALKGTEIRKEEESLDELALLADTAGARVIDRVMQRRERPDPRFYVGPGKVAEIATLAAQGNIDTVVFDNDLSAGQVRNLEASLETGVVDRSELIMDIFALHARTAESKIQVELAQLNYRLPRLTGKGVEMSRLGGGIGTRGPGETKLEVDRRRIRDRIAHLKKELRQVEAQRAVQRKRRKDRFRVALVGYTNAGKTTLMNALTRESLPVEDRLFVTLDATTRALTLNGESALLTDTVGFIRKLPHLLIASFRATLEEVLNADLLLHVVDASRAHFEDQIGAVDSVLEELGARDKAALLVLNKSDLGLDEVAVSRMVALREESIVVSSLDGSGIPQLLHRIRQRVQGGKTVKSLRLSARDSRLLAQLHAHGEVLEEKFEGDQVSVRVRIAAEVWDRISPDRNAERRGS